VALKQTLGVGASTVSYSDWLNTKLIVLLGTNLANNQPVSMKYLYHAKKNGARIVSVNPYREPGLDRYWIPSILKSAIFGTRFVDDFFPVGLGGDVAFLNGVLKWLIELGAVDREFIAKTNCWVEMKAALDQQGWAELEAGAGLSREEMRRFAEIYAKAPSAIFIWSMGLTQHPHGVDNVKAVVNLALARGMVGRANCGVVPIRGHSGVQGGGECGSVPDTFPGGMPVTEESAARFQKFWGAPVPGWKGMHCGAMLEAAADGELDFLYIIGGNFLETMPDPLRMRFAHNRTPVRVHQDIVFNTSMLLDSAEATVLLPAKTRYEHEGGVTQTSTERRIRYSPHVPGHAVGETKAEWEILTEVGKRALEGAAREAISFHSTEQIREEMDRVMPLYRGIALLKAEGESFQYGGPRLLEGGICPAFPDQKPRFSVLIPPSAEPAPETFLLTTRRGAQFNSIVFAGRDALTGSEREDVFMHPGDAGRMGLAERDAVVITSSLGEMRGRVRFAEVKPGTLQAHWPEANVLLPRSYDVASGEPDYNARVRVARG
jgi:molybdopterin-dependent oxidoreductase alpha subunit